MTVEEKEREIAVDSAIADYIDSVSKLAGINFWEMMTMRVEEAISIVSGTAEGYLDEFMVDGALKVLLRSAEKEIPKKVLYEYDGYSDGVPVYDMARCPNCGHVFDEDEQGWEQDCCLKCGQRLDWSEDHDDFETDTKE